MFFLSNRLLNCQNDLNSIVQVSDSTKIKVARLFSRATFKKELKDCDFGNVFFYQTDC